MFKKSKSDSKSYGIIGLGRFGSALAVELAKSGAEPLVIDGNEEKVREMREYTENAFVVNSFDKKTLSETGIQNSRQNRKKMFAISSKSGRHTKLHKRRAP